MCWCAIKKLLTHSLWISDAAAAARASEGVIYHLKVTVGWAGADGGAYCCWNFVTYCDLISHRLGAWHLQYTQRSGDAPRYGASSWSISPQSLAFFVSFAVLFDIQLIRQSVPSFSKYASSLAEQSFNCCLDGIGVLNFRKSCLIRGCSL